MTLADPVEPDAAALVAAAIEESGYSPLTAPTDAPKTMSKKKSVGALGELVIIQVDGDGNEIEKWTLVNAWIKDVKTGELDYESDDLVNVELEIRYDFAHLWVATSGEDYKQEIFKP